MNSLKIFILSLFLFSFFPHTILAGWNPIEADYETQKKIIGDAQKKVEKASNDVYEAQKAAIRKAQSELLSRENEKTVNKENVEEKFQQLETKISFALKEKENIIIIKEAVQGNNKAIEKRDKRHGCQAYTVDSSLIGLTPMPLEELGGDCRRSPEFFKPFDIGGAV